MSFNIENKIALVTGANRGIGKAIVESFIAHGAKKVYLAVRTPSSAEALVKRYGEKVQSIELDVSKPETVSAAANIAGDVDIVVNNAGVLNIASPLDDGFDAAFNEELNVNTFGLIRVAQAFAPILEQRTEAAFVQLNSVASIKNFTPFTSYSASKAASYAITQGLRDEFATKGIKVLSVHPGPIATDMADKAGFGDDVEPVALVSEGIVNSLKAGDFHLFPDAVAETFRAAYEGYAQNIVETEPSEA